MAIEVSPRISFSHDLCPSPSFSNSARRIEHSTTIETISADFDFSTSYEVDSLDDYSTPADLLFSQGKLLPLNYNSIPISSSPIPIPIPKQDQTNKQIRSNSVGNSSKNNREEVSVSVWPFQRSKSTGYSPNQKLYGSKRSKSASNSNSNSGNAKAYYYSGDRRLPCNNIGVRINPVINVPATFIPRGGSAGSSTSSSGGGGSCTTTNGGNGNGGGAGGGSFFAYLLCNCRDKNMEMDDNEGV